MAPASLANWDRILPTLQTREREVFLLLARYLADTEHEDATGGELAAHFGKLVTRVRPRLHGLHRKGLLYSGPKRISRAKDEAPSHPYWLAVPAAAIQRIKEPK